MGGKEATSGSMAAGGKREGSAMRGTVPLMGLWCPHRRNSCLQGVGEVQIWFLSEPKTSEASSFGVWLSVSVHGTGRVANFQFISYRLE